MWLLCDVACMVMYIWRGLSRLSLWNDVKRRRRRETIDKYTLRIILHYLQPPISIHLCTQSFDFPLISAALFSPSARLLSSLSANFLSLSSPAFHPSSLNSATLSRYISALSSP